MKAIKRTSNNVLVALFRSGIKNEATYIADDEIIGDDPIRPQIIRGLGDSWGDRNDIVDIEAGTVKSFETDNGPFEAGAWAWNGSKLTKVKGFVSPLARSIEAHQTAAEQMISRLGVFPNG